MPSSRCNLAYCRSQCVPLKRTCQKDFGLHLSKTNSFLIIQTAQQSADVAVNNNALNFLLADFKQLLKRLDYQYFEEVKF
jgi:hypothetical protein